VTQEITTTKKTLSIHRLHEEIFTSSIRIGIYLFGTARTAYDKESALSQAQVDNTTTLYLRQKPTPNNIKDKTKILNHQTTRCTVTGKN
jgi:hypothetical protein